MSLKITCAYDYRVARGPLAQSRTEIIELKLFVCAQDHAGNLVLITKPG